MLTGGYWDGYLVTPFTTRPDPPRRIAILGFAGGTIARAYAHYFPRTIIDGVEIDGELFDIGHRYFGLRKRPQLREHTEDARPFLRHTTARYDSIFLDTYRQPYIPFYLSTHEFFELVRDRLAPGGSVIVNLGHPEGHDELEKVLTATMGERLRPRRARPDQADQHAADRLADHAHGGRPPRGAAPAGGAAPARARLGRPAGAGPLNGGAVYTDDKAPVEWLIDKSIVEYAAGG